MSAADGLSSCVVLPPDGVDADGPSTPSTAALASPAWALLSAVRHIGLQSLLLQPVVERARTRPLGWHPRGCRLAVLAEKGLVVIHKINPSSLLFTDDAPERLTHAGVRAVAAIAWRPMASSFLAIAHAGGVCLWTCDSVLAPALATGIRGLAAPSSWRRTTLQSGKAKQPVTALCWSPCGQFLAAGSPQDSAFAVWDIATRECTRLRSGAVGARVLRWSPLGNYLLVAGFDKRDFEIWETHSWTCQNWSTGSHALTDAAWAADESAVLIALDDSSQLGVLHLVGSAPSLLAHLLPLDLPDLPARSEGSSVHISSIAFDSMAGKLAVACADGDDPDARHAVCLYALQSSPVYLAKPLGHVQPPADTGSTASPCKLQVAFRPASASAQPRSVLAITWQDGSVALASV